MIKKIISMAVAVAMLLTIPLMDVSAAETDNGVEPSGSELNTDIEALDIADTVTVEVTATPGDKKADLSWTITGADECFSVVYSVMQQKTDGSGEYDTLASDIPKETCSYSVANLTNGSAYNFKVLATVVDVEGNDPVDVEGTVSVSLPIPITPADLKVTGLRTISDYKSVTLVWNPVAKAQGYRVYRNGALVKTVVGASNRTLRVTAAEGTVYTFGVEAYNGSVKGARLNAKDDAVRPMYATFKAKARKPYYKKSKGKSKAGYLVKGKSYKAENFVCGRLRLMMNGKIYYVPRIYAKSVSLQYNRSKDANYTREEVQYYVNHRGLTSRTKYLAFVSLYQQHAYFFTGSKGKWKCVKDWEVSTGEAKSATATGEWVVKKKHKKKNSLAYWTTFYSGVSFHSWGNTKCFGVPHSGGCVRSAKSNALWAYKTLPMGTKVVTY